MAIAEAQYSATMLVHWNLVWYLRCSGWASRYLRVQCVCIAPKALAADMRFVVQPLATRRLRRLTGHLVWLGHRGIWQLALWAHEQVWLNKGPRC